MVSTPEERAQILCVVPSVRRSILTVSVMSHATRVQVRSLELNVKSLPWLWGAGLKCGLAGMLTLVLQAGHHTVKHHDEVMQEPHRRELYMRS